MIFKGEVKKKGGKYPIATVHLGDIKSGSKNVPVFWEFDKGSPNDIAKDPQGKWAIQTTCGCSKNVIVSEQGVGVTYSNGGKNERNKEFTKTVFAYLKPKEDMPIKVLNPKGKSIFNPKLEYVRLDFKFNII